MAYPDNPEVASSHSFQIYACARAKDCWGIKLQKVILSETKTVGKLKFIVKY
jgi:hypothetical protein